MRYTVNLIIDEVPPRQLNWWTGNTNLDVSTMNTIWSQVKRELNIKRSIDKDILAWVDKISAGFDLNVGSNMQTLVQDLLDDIVDPDEIDTSNIDILDIIDGLPCIDVVALEDEMRDAMIEPVFEWKLAWRATNAEHWCLSTPDGDYFVVINMFPEV